MCSTALLCSSLPFSTPLHPACPTIYPSARPLPRHGMVSSDRDELTRGGAAGSWGSGKTSSPSLINIAALPGESQHRPTYSIMSLEERIRCLGLTCQHCYLYKWWRKACFIIHSFFKGGGEVWREWKAEDVQESNYEQVGHVSSQLKSQDVAETWTQAPPAATGWQDWLRAARSSVVPPKWYEWFPS